MYLNNSVNYIYEKRYVATVRLKRELRGFHTRSEVQNPIHIHIRVLLCLIFSRNRVWINTNYRTNKT